MSENKPTSPVASLENCIFFNILYNFSLVSIIFLKYIGIIVLKSQLKWNFGYFLVIRVGKDLKSDGGPTRCSQRDRVQLRSSVFNGRPYCYSSVSFSLLLLRSSVSNGRPFCYSIVSFSLLLRSSVSNGRPFCYSIVSF